MRTDTIRAAAVQIAPDLSGRAGTIERVLNAIAEIPARVRQAKRSSVEMD